MFFVTGVANSIMGEGILIYSSLQTIELEAIDFKSISLCRTLIYEYVPPPNYRDYYATVFFCRYNVNFVSGHYLQPNQFVVINNLILAVFSRMLQHI